MEAAQFVANNYYNQNLRLFSFVRARAGILNGTAHFEEYADPCFVTDSVTLQLGATEETMNAESEIRRGALAPGSADLSSRTSPPSHGEHQSGFANCLDSGRDPVVRRKRCGADLAKRKETILFVTHDIEEAIQIADRVRVMSNRLATIQEIVAVDFPRRRDLDSLGYLEKRERIFRVMGMSLRVGEAAAA